MKLKYILDLDENIQKMSSTPGRQTGFFKLMRDCTKNYVEEITKQKSEHLAHSFSNLLRKFNEKYAIGSWQSLAISSFPFPGYSLMQLHSAINFLQGSIGVAEAEYHESIECSSFGYSDVDGVYVFPAYTRYSRTQFISSGLNVMYNIDMLNFPPSVAFVDIKGVLIPASLVTKKRNRYRIKTMGVLSIEYDDSLSDKISSPKPSVDEVPATPKLPEQSREKSPKLLVAESRNNVKMNKNSIIKSPKLSTTKSLPMPELDTLQYENQSTKPIDTEESPRSSMDVRSEKDQHPKSPTTNPPSTAKLDTQPNNNNQPPKTSTVKSSPAREQATQLQKNRVVKSVNTESSTKSELTVQSSESRLANLNVSKLPLSAKPDVQQSSDNAPETSTEKVLHSPQLTKRTASETLGTRKLCADKEANSVSEATADKSVAKYIASRPIEIEVLLANCSECENLLSEKLDSYELLCAACGKVFVTQESIDNYINTAIREYIDGNSSKVTKHLARAKIRKRTGPVDLVTERESEMRQAQDMYDRLANHDGVDAINGFHDILDICNDFAPALEKLRTLPLILPHAKLKKSSDQLKVEIYRIPTGERNVVYKFVRSVDGEDPFVLAIDPAHVDYTDRPAPYGRRLSYALSIERQILGRQSEVSVEIARKDFVLIPDVLNLDYDLNDTSVYISWTEPEGATGCNIVLIRDGVELTVAENAHGEFVGHNLEYNTNYEYKVVVKYPNLYRSNGKSISVTPIQRIIDFELSHKRVRGNKQLLQWEIPDAIRGVEMTVLVNNKEYARLPAHVGGCDVELMYSGVFELCVIATKNCETLRKSIIINSLGFDTYVEWRLKRPFKLFPKHWTLQIKMVSEHEELYEFENMVLCVASNGKKLRSHTDQHAKVLAHIKGEKLRVPKKEYQFEIKFEAMLDGLLVVDEDIQLLMEFENTAYKYKIVRSDL